MEAEKNIMFVILLTSLAVQGLLYSFTPENARAPVWMIVVCYILLQCISVELNMNLSGYLRGLGNLLVMAFLLTPNTGTTDFTNKIRNGLQQFAARLLGISVTLTIADLFVLVCYNSQKQ